MLPSMLGILTSRTGLLGLLRWAVCALAFQLIAGVALFSVAAGAASSFAAGVSAVCNRASAAACSLAGWGSCSWALMTAGNKIIKASAAHFIFVAPLRGQNLVFSCPGPGPSCFSTRWT